MQPQNALNPDVSWTLLLVAFMLSNEHCICGALDHVPVTYFVTQFTRGTANNVQSAILVMASLFRGNHI